MSPLCVEMHTIRVICNHFADRPKFELDCSDFVRVIQIKLPGAAVMHGYAVGEEEHGLPHSWIRVGNKDYDVQLIAQRLRALKFGFDMPPDRVLAAKWNNDGERDNSYVDMHSAELVDWFLPSCAACRGEKRAHTLDGGCIAPRKAEHIERRAKDWQDIKDRPLMYFKGTGSRCNYV